MRRLAGPLAVASLACFAQPAAALTARARTALARGTEELLRLRFVPARAVFRGLIEVDPKDPAGYLFEAAAIWFEGATEPVYGRPSSGLERIFEEDLDRALRLSRALAREELEGLRADGELIAGLALGLRGLRHWEAGDRRRGLSYGRKAVKHLERALAIDPKLYDANFGLGVFHSLTGDEEGVYELMSAAKGGEWTRDAAEFFLLRAQVLEGKDYAKGAKTLASLRERHADSPLLRLVEAAVLHRLGRWPESWRAARELFTRSREDRPLMGELHPRVLCGFYAHRCLEPGSLAAVAEWISRGLQEEKAGGAWESLLRLYRGAAYDAAGDRDLALRDYKRVRSAPELASLLFARDLCLAAPCGRARLVELLAELSALKPQE